MFMRRLFIVLLGVLLVASCATDREGQRILGQGCAAKSSNSGDIGVILLHGKWGSPHAQTIAPLTWAFQDAGYHVAAEYMPWSGARLYDKSYEAAMQEIDNLAANLRQAGARRVVVVGHSLGANAALAYAATRKGLAGVVAIAPGHTPDKAGFARKTSGDLAEARRMVEQGDGKKSGSFKDLNTGYRETTLRIPAETYVSYFDPDGLANMPKSAAAIEPGTPLLWIEANSVAASDAFGPGYAFAKAPSNAKSAFVYISAGHMQAPASSANIVVAWVNCL